MNTRQFRTRDGSRFMEAPLDGSSVGGGYDKEF